MTVAVSLDVTGADGALEMRLVAALSNIEDPRDVGRSGSPALAMLEKGVVRGQNSRKAFRDIGSDG